MARADALLDTAGIQFTGPFAFVFHAIQPHDSKADAPVTVPLAVSSRYFYDPPEVTALAHFPSATVKHWGYFRDDPASLPVAVVESDDRRGSTFSFIADGLFAAAHRLLTSVPSSAAVSEQLRAVEAAAAAHGHSVACKASFVRERKKAQTAETLSGLGLLVPYDADTTVGYRPLPFDAGKLRALLRRIAAGHPSPADVKAFEEMQTFAHIANDECDFGTMAACVHVHSTAGAALTSCCGCHVVGCGRHGLGARPRAVVVLARIHSRCQ